MNQNKLNIERSSQEQTDSIVQKLILFGDEQQFQQSVGQLVGTAQFLDFMKGVYADLEDVQYHIKRAYSYYHFFAKETPVTALSWRRVIWAWLHRTRMETKQTVAPNLF